MLNIPINIQKKVLEISDMRNMLKTRIDKYGTKIEGVRGVSFVLILKQLEAELGKMFVDHLKDQKIIF